MTTYHRAMGLDVGDSRIGIALSDLLGITAQPYDTIKRDAQSIEAIVQIIIDQSVNKVVVGLPLNLDGSASEQSLKTIRFADALKEKLKEVAPESSIEVLYWDERMSSKQAEFSLQGSKLKNKDRRSATDRIAAAILLSSYMDSLSLNYRP